MVPVIISPISQKLNMNVKFNKNSFSVIFLWCPIILKFCTMHGSDIVVLCANFQKHGTITEDIIENELLRDFSWKWPSDRSGLLLWVPGSWIATHFSTQGRMEIPQGKCWLMHNIIQRSMDHVMTKITILLNIFIHEDKLTNWPPKQRMQKYNDKHIEMFNCKDNQTLLPGALFAINPITFHCMN